MSVVGVSTQAITERDPATPPSDQLKDAVGLVTTSNTPKDFSFTYTVRGIVHSAWYWSANLMLFCLLPPSLVF